MSPVKRALLQGGTIFTVYRMFVCRVGLDWSYFGPGGSSFSKVVGAAALRVCAAASWPNIPHPLAPANIVVYLKSDHWIATGRGAL